MGERLGAKLAKFNLNPVLFFHFWLVTVERDSAYMTLIERPKTTTNVERWKICFPRVLYQSGVPPSEIDSFASEADLDYIMDKYLWHLRPRSGFASMLKTLKEAGIEFYSCSGAAPPRVKSYFKDAGLEIDDEHIWDAATLVGMHKPQLPVYRRVVEDYKKDDQVLIFGGELS